MAGEVVQLELLGRSVNRKGGSGVNVKQGTVVTAHHFNH
jgi:hypothetical protein